MYVYIYSDSFVMFCQFTIIQITELQFDDYALCFPKMPGLVLLVEAPCILQNQFIIVYTGARRSFSSVSKFALTL